ncbi:MAG: RdgB/HAM1 family non-canonical purine NTP pyrophosphatase [Verrucomicrobia bacterium]|nr:RdgB/HAM1 family non-canonical purine NTP pyrophosphatase [Verrucomicrobiota bacterium]
MELVIASRNMHKIREFRAILKKIGNFDLLSLIDFPHYAPLPETGNSFEENAIFKAVHAAKKLNRWVIADDSGLVVPALNGAPGIHSRRYAHDNPTDKENRQKLLKEMSHLQETSRQGYFECWIALASPDGLKKTAKGVSEGMITDKERGSLGFGYDAIFVKHEYGKTFAELEEETKNRISHRRKALEKLLPQLESLLQDADTLSR